MILCLKAAVTVSATMLAGCVKSKFSRLFCEISYAYV